MTTNFERITYKLNKNQQTWFVTGVAGFIGSHILETLLKLNQKVIGLDNYFSGYEDNLTQVKELVTADQWKNFTFIEDDIRNKKLLLEKTKGVDFVLHQAALCSVPQSMSEPELAHDINVNGFINILEACRKNGIKSLVYASSSAVYGDDPATAKREGRIGQILSPYGLTKYIDELYAEHYAKLFGLKCVGLRYFNVFGPRQDPDGAYAAIIPKWVACMIRDDPITIYGDGDMTRDFCYVGNVVQANILAAIMPLHDKNYHVFNVGCGLRTSINELFRTLQEMLMTEYPHVKTIRPINGDSRMGDIKNSLADIMQIQNRLKYDAAILLNEGLNLSIDWYKKQV
ncbi:MAG: NAD-dependent epimerase/dehydratase family protein [bacterium]|nr:NAD-dependent epimerase/dehydratase family protein [bacterium]MBU1919112.1 NAD-dependent epimerase/dehydratase family protein [bacterium]